MPGEFPALGLTSIFWSWNKHNNCTAGAHFWTSDALLKRHRCEAPPSERPRHPSLRPDRKLASFLRSWSFRRRAGGTQSRFGCQPQNEPPGVWFGNCSNLFRHILLSEVGTSQECLYLDGNLSLCIRILARQ